MAFIAIYLAIALATWTWLTPSLGMMKSLAPGWIGLILIRNAALITLVVGVWHLRLYVQKAQDTKYKYNGRWLAKDSKNFLFHDQVLDNVFWTFVSAVPVWTAFEVATLWGQANGFFPVVDWAAHPVYCAALLLFIPVWREAHFYAIHRLIHWPPLYRNVHRLHHTNVNPGPWLGLSMHPVEHALYFSGVVLHWIVPKPAPRHLPPSAPRLFPGPGSQWLRQSRVEGRAHDQHRPLHPLPAPQVFRGELRRRPRAARQALRNFSRRF